MKHFPSILLLFFILATSCTSQKKLAYLNNPPETGGEQYFKTEIPEYKIQNRDVLYITIKAMTPEGLVRDFLAPAQSGQTINYSQGEGGGYLYGYEVDSEGNIILPVLGKIKVIDLNLEQSRILLQEKSDSVFKNATVECKLLSYRFTVIGEVRNPGTYVNFSTYLTVLEAIGRAGGLGDYGRRDKILVVRPLGNSTKTYTLNLQDKELLESEAYFLLPNDVVIVEPESGKLFNLNFPPVASILATITSLITTTLLLIDYFGNP